MSTCPVCYTERAAAYFVCGHGLCKQCATLWFSKVNTCPMCRLDVGPSFCHIDALPYLDGKREILSKLEGYTCSYNKNVFITDMGVVSWVKKNVHIT